MDPIKLTEIVEDLAKTFPSFGQGSTPAFNNPISIALKEKPPQFALGVDIQTIVEHVAAALSAPALSGAAEAHHLSREDQVSMEMAARASGAPSGASREDVLALIERLELSSKLHRSNAIAGVDWVADSVLLHILANQDRDAAALIRRLAAQPEGGTR